MKTILLLSLLSLIAIAILPRLKRIRMRKINYNKCDYNMNSWMAMRREERSAFDEQEKKTSLERKKVLLDQIRKEYKDLKKGSDQ